MVLPPDIRQSGFSLVTTALVLTAAALVLVSVLPASQDNNRKTIANVTKLERVEDAMRAFKAANGRLPCPADGSLAVSNANFGMETDTLGDGNCTGAPLSGGSEDVGGVIPTTSLDLPAGDMIDDYGHRFTYIVDKKATKNSSCLALAQGGVTIHNGSGATLGNSMYAFISHGKSGYGAWPAQGGANRIYTGTTDSDMLTDAGTHQNITNYEPGWTGNGILVQKAPTGSFDLMVWYQPNEDNSCALGPYAAPNHCNTAAPNGPLDSTFSPATLPGAPPGNSMTAYANSSGTCTANTLTCSDGSLSCKDSLGNLLALTQCDYSSCSALNCATAGPPPVGRTGPLDSSFTPTSMKVGDAPIKAFPHPTDTTSDTTCSPSYTVSCINVGGVGTLSCSTGGTSDLTDCMYANCQPTGCDTSALTGFPNPMTSGTSQTVYVAANDPACTPHVLACNSGTLTCDGSSTLTNCQNNITSCVQECALSSSQNSGASGGYLDGQASGPLGNTKPEFTNSSVVSPATCDNGGAGNTMTCTGTATTNSLTCATGNMNNCQYSSCSVTGGGGSGPGDVWVVDYGKNNRVQGFTATGTYVTYFGTNGTGDNLGFLGGSHGIAIDSAGDMWVADDYNHHIHEFVGNVSSGYVDKYKTTLPAGDTPGQIDTPEHILFDKSGDLWASDYAANFVEKLNVGSGPSPSVAYSGVYLGCTTPPCAPSAAGGQFANPAGIAIDNNSGNFWVVDLGNNRLEEFNPTGGFVQQVPAAGLFGCQTGATPSVPECPAGPGKGQFNTPWGIAIDSNHNLWVTDWGNDRVEIFDSSGGYLTAFGTSGSANGDFAGPTGIAISGSTAWVSDEGNNRVEEFNISGTASLPTATFSGGLGCGYGSLATTCAVGRSGNGNGELNTPMGLVIY